MTLSFSFYAYLSYLCHSTVTFSPHPSPLQSIGKLRQLRYLDLAKNRIETLDTDISGCEALEDLLLSSNMLQHLPDTIGTHTCMHKHTHRHSQTFPKLMKLQRSI